MATSTLSGNQVAEWLSIDDTTAEGEAISRLGCISTLTPSDTISITTEDANINPDGTLITSAGGVLVAISVNGSVVAEDIELKIETGGDAKEYGGCLLLTHEAVDLNGDGVASKLAFLISDRFTDGENMAIIQDSNVENSTDFDLDLVCFAKGTRIKTAMGEVPIEELRPDSLVWTLESGFLPVLWIGRSRVTFDGRQGNDPPVLIKPNALGEGRPKRNLIVSSQHRILVGSGGQLEDVFNQSGFAPAKGLLTLSNIRFMHGRKNIVWYHLLLERHSVILANGAYAESLLLGAVVLEMLSDEDKQRIERLVSVNPMLKFETMQLPALPLIRVQQAKDRIHSAKSAPV